MISRPEWYAFLIVALVAVLWLARKLDKILEELKALRGKASERTGAEAESGRGAKPVLR